MYRFNKNDLFEIWLQGADKNEKCNAVLLHIKKSIKTDIDEFNTKKLEQKVRRLCLDFYEKWVKASRNKDYVKNKHSVWLNGDFFIELNEPMPSTSSGRPTLPFDEKSCRSKRREVSQLARAKQNESSLLVGAASMAARQQGQHDLATVLKEVTKSPTRPTKVRKLMQSPPRVTLKYTAEEALELILDSNLSKKQYCDIRQGAVLRNCNLYPDYKEVWKCKSMCRPSGINVTDIMAEVPLKNLLQHTTERIVLLQKEVTLRYMESVENKEIRTEIIFSYGFDGSSGQSLYKQKFDTPGSHSDASLFATTIIPLRWQTNNGVVLWNNRTPQSVRFCRPLKLQYAKESKEHIINEKRNIDAQIDQLENLVIPLSEDKMINIKYRLFMTLIDGKILNTLTGTKSSQACPICGATPREFLQVKDFKTTDVFDPKPNTLQFGISPLHSWIRFFECIIHISYRQDLCQWQIRGTDNKEIFNNRKKIVQDLFLKELHLHVDKPKSNGFGSTNDGNTARRAFANTKKFSELTNVDEDLIKRFKVILICLSCQYQIDTEKFEKYCHATAQLFMAKYPWYPMPATVHKVLVHGRQIIESTILPLGYFGEEGSEGRNKFYKHDRLFHARKSSRKNNLEDVFNRAMDTSDPIISSLNLQKRINRQHTLKLPSEVISLLLSEWKSEENIGIAVVESEDSDNEEDFLEEISQVHQLDDLELENDD